MLDAKRLKQIFKTFDKIMVHNKESDDYIVFKILNSYY